MGGVLSCLIFSYSQNPTGYEFEQDYSFCGEERANSRSLLLRWETQVASGLMKRAIKNKIVQPF